MTPIISVAMIVRDEEKNLAACLNSFRGEVDEIVIVDTGSRDGTLNIAREFTDKLYSYEWHGDFSAARNFAIAKCAGDWVLSLDADEQLEAEAGGLRQLIASHPETEVFFLPLFMGSGVACEQCAVLRLFRNTGEYRFFGKIHEQVMVNNPNVVVMAGAPVIRHKLVGGKDYNKKRHRNLQLLKQALASEPDNYFLKYYLGVEWLCLDRHEKALPCLQEAAANIDAGCVLFRGMAVRRLIDCLKILGRLHDAFTVCLNEGKRYPGYTDIFFEIGTILAAKGKFDHAIDYFHKAIQLGSPPPVFYHLRGTESFLAFHQLGHCYEKTGFYELAERYYWQALDVCPEYIGSLYGLFLLKISNLSAPDVFAYFKNKNSLVYNQWVERLASMFFEMGLPGLAAQCYKESPALSVGQDIKQIKCLLYSGRIDEALAVINVTGCPKGRPEIATEEIVAHILNEDYDTAKRQTLVLWRNFPSQRSTAWALLTIIARSTTGHGYSKPEDSRKTEVIRTYLAILQNCLRFKRLCPGMAQTSTLFNKLITTIMEILTKLSAESNLELAEFFHNKAGEVRSLMDYKWISARGLYL